jgi:hypothetical protein
MDFEKAKANLRVLRFDKPGADWFDFVCNNRLDKYVGEAYDVIVGPVANDTVYRVFNNYEDGDITREMAIEMLKVVTLYNQMAFCAQAAIDMLKFVNSEVLENE